MYATLYEGPSFTVYDYRCTRGPHDRPYTEMHARHSVSYVRRGSFGALVRGESREFVAGALFVGRPGLEYTAFHEHHRCGDECLSVKLAPGFADSFSRDKTIWDVARVPPLPELMVLGELAQAAAEGRTSVGLEEAALLLVQRFATIVGGHDGASAKASETEKRRAVEAALWMEENLAAEIGLEEAARRAGSSPFHFLRTFRKVLGVTPHQYLLRLRLKRAARLLAQEEMPVTEVALEAGFADLSNFVRTFRRAAGASPRAFRRAARAPGYASSTNENWLSPSGPS